MYNIRTLRQCSAGIKHARQRALLCARNGQTIYALHLDPHTAVRAVVAR